MQKFKDDFTLNIMLAHANAKAGNPKRAYKAIVDAAPAHGIDTRSDSAETICAQADQLHTRAALMSTMKIVEWIEAYAKKHNKKVLYVLSFPARDIAKYIEEGKRFDKPFVDFLKEKRLPFHCLMESHLEDYKQYRLSIRDYLKRYFYGHYNPRGNFFCAFAIKDKVVEMLAPKPPAYQ